MSAQPHRYLVKAVQSAAAGEKLAGNVQYGQAHLASIPRTHAHADRCALPWAVFDRYLNNLARLPEERWQVREAADVLSPALQLDAFRHRVAQLVGRVGNEVRARISAGADFKSAFDASAVDIVEATKAHWCAYSPSAHSRERGRGQGNELTNVLVRIS